MVVVILVVQLLPSTGLVPPAYFPTSLEIAAALLGQFASPTFWTAVLNTLTGWFLGVGIATIAAIVVGTIIGLSRPLENILTSTIEFLRPIPSVSLIPLAVLLYGPGLESKLLLVVYAAFWQVFIQVLYGVHDIDPVARDTARVYGFRWTARFRHLVLPTMLPYLVTGVRLAVSLGLVLSVTAELIIGNPGIGSQILVAQTSGAIPTIYALVVFAGILGMVVNLLMRLLERRILSWHPEQRKERVS